MAHVFVVSCLLHGERAIKQETHWLQHRQCVLQSTSAVAKGVFARTGLVRKVKDSKHVVFAELI